MKFFKKIIALFCIIAISFSFFSVPVFAVGAGEIADFGQWLADFGQWAIDSSLYGIKLVARIFDDDVCPERPGGVNTTHSFVVNKTSKAGVLADWYVCEYCGFNSGYKADSESLSVAYDDYVSTLPASAFNSAGRLIYRPLRCILSSRSSSSSYTQISFQNNKYYSIGNGCFIYNRTYASPLTDDQMIFLLDSSFLFWFLFLAIIGFYLGWLIHILLVQFLVLNTVQKVLSNIILQLLALRCLMGLKLITLLLR